MVGPEHLNFDDSGEPGWKLGHRRAGRGRPLLLEVEALPAAVEFLDFLAPVRQLGIGFLFPCWSHGGPVRVETFNLISEYS